MDPTTSAISTENARLNSRGEENCRNSSQKEILGRNKHPRIERSFSVKLASKEAYNLQHVIQWKSRVIKSFIIKEFDSP